MRAKHAAKFEMTVKNACMGHAWGREQLEREKWVGVNKLQQNVTPTNITEHSFLGVSQAQNNNNCSSVNFEMTSGCAPLDITLGGSNILTVGLIINMIYDQTRSKVFYSGHY